MKKFYYLFALLMCMLGVQSASAQKTYHALVTFDDVPSIKAVTGVSVDGTVEGNADVYNHAPGVAFAEGADLKVLLDPAYVITKCLVETTDGNSVIAEQNINVTPNATAVNIPTDGNKHIWIKARKLVTDKYDIPYTIDTKDGVGVDPVVFMSKGAYSPLHELAHSGLKGGVVTDEFAEYLIIKPNALTDGYIKKVVFTTKDGDVEGVADGDGEYSIALEGLLSVYIEANEVDRGTDIVVNVDKNVALTTRFFDLQGQDKKYFFHYTTNEVDSNDPAPEPTNIPNVGDNTVKIDPNYDFPLTIAFSNIYNSQGKVYIVAADGTKKAVEGQYTWTIDALADGESIAVEIGEPNRVTPVRIVVDKNIAKYTYSFDVVNAKKDNFFYHWTVGTPDPNDPNPVEIKFPTEGAAETFKVDFDYDFPLNITIANIYSSDSKVVVRNIETGEVRDVTVESPGHNFTITPDFDPATEEIVVTVGEANRNTAVRMIVDKNVRQNTYSFDVVNAKKDKFFYHWTVADPDPNDPNPVTIVLPETGTASVFNVDFNYDFPLDITIANIFGTASKVAIRNIETGELRDETVDHHFTITPDFDPATEEIVVTVGEPNRTKPVNIAVNENVRKASRFFNVRGAHGDFFYYYDANAPEDDPNPINVATPEVGKWNVFKVDENWDMPLEIAVMSKYDNTPCKVGVYNFDINDYDWLTSENGVTYKIESLPEFAYISVEFGNPINRNTPVKLFVDKDVTKTTYHFSVEGKDNRAELDLAPNKFLHYMIGETDNVLPNVGGLTQFDVDAKYDLPLTVRFQNNFGEEGNDGFVVVEREVDGVKTFIEYAPNQEITDFDPATDVIRVYIGIKRDKLAFVRFDKKVEDNAYFFDIKAADITANHRGKTFMSYYQGQDCNIVINPDVNTFWYDATCELPLLVSFQTKPNLIQGTASVKVVNKYDSENYYEAQLVEGSTGTYAIYNYDGTEQDIVIDWGLPVKERDQKVIVTVNEDVQDHAYTLFARNEIFDNNHNDVYGAKFMDYTQGDEETINRGDYEWLINTEIDDVIIITSNLKFGHSLTVLVNGVDVVNERGEGSSVAEFKLKGLKKNDHVNIRFDKDVTVGIDNVNANKLNGKIYTINGVEVKEATQPGLYIVNGKKVVVK